MREKKYAFEVFSAMPAYYRQSLLGDEVLSLILLLGPCT